MSKFLYKKVVIVPHNGKMYKFVESLEEISSEEIETIDLTAEEPTSGQPTSGQPATGNQQAFLVSPSYQPGSPTQQLSPQYSPTYPGYASSDEPPYSPYTQTEEYRGAQNVNV